MDVNGELHTPIALIPVEIAPGTHWIGGWVGPSIGLKAVAMRKSPCHYRESNLRRSACSLFTTLTELSQLLIIVLIVISNLFCVSRLFMSCKFSNPRMRGAITPLPQYAFMAWCSVQAQGQLCLYVFNPFILEF
jgi:hypothetical protein